MAKYDFDLRDYWRILRKRKFTVVLSAFLVGVLSYGFAKFSQPSPLYKATAAVKIEKVATLASLLMNVVSWSSGDNIATQAAIITSFPVLAQSAKDLGWIPQGLPSEEIRRSQKFLSMIERLKSTVETEKEKGTSIINITVISQDPNEAALIADTIAKAYRNYNILERNRQTLETRKFIEKQLKVTETQLKQAEQRLRSFKENSHIVALDAQTTNIISRIAVAESDYDKVRRKKEEIAFQLTRTQTGEITSKSLKGAFFSEDPDFPIRQLITKLSQLILKRETLLLDYTEVHPQVIDINNQIDRVLNQIRSELTLYLQTLEAREADLLETMHRLRQQSASIPESALELARLEREVKLTESLYSELKTKYQEALIQESGKVEEVSIIRPPSVPERPINVLPKVKVTLTGAIIGLILGTVLAFITETLDTSMGTIEDVESFLQVPVLGVIPFVELKGRGKEKGVGEKGCAEVGSELVTHFEPKSVVSEAYRSLRTNLQYMSTERKGKSFLVTSASLQEGKTMNVVNLALSMVQAGVKVLLIEADLRRPTVHKMFGLNQAPGLTDFVLGNFQRREVINTIKDIMLGEFEMADVLKTPGLDNLSIITAGTTAPNPSEILNSQRFEEFTQEIQREYDVILFDAPPVLPVADATELGPKVDGVILVYQVGKIARGVLKRAKLTLDNVNAKVWGVVLNNVKPEVSPDFYRYYHRYYYTAEEVKDPKSKLRQAMPSPLRKILTFKDALLVTEWTRFRTLILILFIALLFAIGIAWHNYPGIRSTYHRILGLNTKALISAGNSQRSNEFPNQSSKAEQVVEMPVAMHKSVRKPREKSVSAAKASTGAIDYRNPASSVKADISAGNSQRSNEFSSESSKAEQVVEMPVLERKSVRKAPEKSVSAANIPTEATEPVSSQESVAQSYLSLASLANIRSRPEIHAPVLSRIARGTRVRVVEKQGDWLKLKLRNGGTGWIYHSLVRESDFAAEQPPAQVAAESSTVTEQEEFSIEQLVERWRRAWEVGDMAAYVACYHPNFVRGDMDRSGWATYMQSRFAGSAKRNIQLSDLHIQVNGSTAVATFKQHYQTEEYQKYGLKTLHLLRLQDHWTILKETVQTLGTQG